MIRSGVRLPSTSLKQQIFEQEYRETNFTHLLDKMGVTFVSKNGRLSVKFLTHLRMEAFANEYNKLSAEDKLDPKTLEKLADYINVHSGAGGVIGESKNGSINKYWNILTSARNTSSMLQQTYIGMMYQASKNYDSKRKWNDQPILFTQIRNEIINQAVLAGTLILASGLAKMSKSGDDDDDNGEIEINPFSTNFLKVKIGNNYYGDMGGVTALNVASMRLGAMMLNVFGADIKNYKTGDELGKLGGSGWGDKRGFDVLGEATLNRMMPFLSIIKNPLVAKEDKQGNYKLYGKTYSRSEFIGYTLLNMFAPINGISAYEDITDKDQQAINKVANTALSAIGISVKKGYKKDTKTTKFKGGKSLKLSNKSNNGHSLKVKK